MAVSGIPAQYPSMPLVRRRDGHGGRTSSNEIKSGIGKSIGHYDGWGGGFFACGSTSLNTLGQSLRVFVGRWRRLAKPIGWQPLTGSNRRAGEGEDARSRPGNRGQSGSMAAGAKRVATCLGRRNRPSGNPEAPFPPRVRSCCSTRRRTVRPDCRYGWRERPSG